MSSSLRIYAVPDTIDPYEKESPRSVTTRVCIQIPVIIYTKRAERAITALSRSVANTQVHTMNIIYYIAAERASTRI
jgi:hypothetical protein